MIYRVTPFRQLDFVSSSFLVLRQLLKHRIRVSYVHVRRLEKVLILVEEKKDSLFGVCIDGKRIE